MMELFPVKDTTKIETTIVPPFRRKDISWKSLRESGIERLRLPQNWARRKVSHTFQYTYRRFLTFDVSLWAGLRLPIVIR